MTKQSNLPSRSATTTSSTANGSRRSTGDGNFGKLTASTLAIDPNTGKVKWHIQGTLADAWDYYGVNELLLADLKIKGTDTPVLLKADRNGFFFVAHRETGKVLSAEKYVIRPGPTNGMSKPAKPDTSRRLLRRRQNHPPGTTKDQTRHHQTATIGTSVESCLNSNPNEPDPPLLNTAVCPKAFEDGQFGAYSPG
jgi:glucose dehydrogenase